MGVALAPLALAPLAPVRIAHRPFVSRAL